jgi:hypothetical protein
MQVRQVLVASLLAVTAAAAMSQEIDRSETLQGKSLAAQSEQAAATPRDSASAEAPAAKAASDTKLAQAKTHSHGRLDLTRWHQARKPVVEAQG